MKKFSDDTGAASIETRLREELRDHLYESHGVNYAKTRDVPITDLNAWHDAQLH